MEATTVYQYFEDKVGRRPHDETLDTLGLETPCGRVCRDVIDAAVKLAEVAPDAMGTTLHADALFELVNFQVEVLWRG